MDEDVTGGTIFYRISDKRFDSKNVKDTTLHTAFGDLSDGTNSALNLRAGKASRVAMLDFVISEPPAFSQDAQMVGFDLNLHSVMDSRVFSATSDKEDLTGNPYLDIFMLKDGETIEYEGAVKPLDDSGQTFEYRIGRGENWEQQEIATFIASASDGTTKHFIEDFSGTPDKNIKLHTTQGKVKQTLTPYITLDEAYDNKTQYGHLKINGGGMSKDELFLFYGDTYQGHTKVVYLEPADENTPPKNWKAKTERGTKGSLLAHPSTQAVVTMAGVDAVASYYTSGGTAGGMVAGTAKGLTGGYAYEPYAASGYSDKTGKAYRHKGFGDQSHYKKTGYAKGPTVNTSTMSGKSAAFRGNANRAMASNSRMAMLGKGGGYIGAAIIGGYTGYKAGQARNEALTHASSTGDFSGVSRPVSQPKWKNKNVEDLIKYAEENEYAEISQFDENALTTTATWFDMVQEVRDYPKLEIVVEGGATADDTTKNAYGSSEDMLAKSAINFAAGKDGQCMHMFSYCDFDMNKMPWEQEDMNFDSPKSPLQQDTFVSKFDLPAPANIFQANPGQDDIDNNSTGNSDLQQPWELSWDMKIGELGIPYTIHYDDEAATTTGDSYLQTLRRCIAVTFSNTKPEENEDFYTYLYRHTDGLFGEAAWAGGSDIAGFVIDKTLEFTAGVPTFGKTMLTPIAFVSSAGTKHIEVYPTAAKSEATGSSAVYFSELQRDAGFMEIPMSTWLSFKMTCGVHGASGKACGGESQVGTFTGSPSSSDGSRTADTYSNVAPTSTSGSGTGATFSIDVASGGVATFTLTNGGSGYRAGDTLTFADSSMGGGGGADITLTIATTDTTEFEGRYYLTVHDTGTGELIAPQQTGGDREGPIALCSTKDDASTGHSDTVPLNGSTKWLKHMTIWNVNHRWNAAARFDDMLGTKTYSSGGYYGHDWWTSKAISVGNLNDTTNFASNNYTLMKNEFWVDNMRVSGIEPDLVNMTVNDYNTTSTLSQNTINEDDSVVRYHADRVPWARGGSLVTTHGPINNVPATVLALGFDSAVNLTGGADENAEYLLFNDFWAESMTNTTRPVAFTDEQMKAGYYTGATKLGDWIDAFHTVEDTFESDFSLSGSHNATVTTLGVSNLTENSADILKVGDIIKCNSEKMLVVQVRSSDENIDVVRGVCGTTAASHGSDNLLICGRSNFSKLLIGKDASESIRATTTTMDIVTGTGSGNLAFDKNRSSGHLTYVEGFSQKGMVTIENNMSGWIKGECIYASSKIAKIGFDTVAKQNAVTKNTAQIVVSNKKVLDFEIGTNGQQYMIYKYGSTKSFHRTTGTAAIVTISKKGEVTDIVRDSTTTWGGSSGLDGCYLDTLITPENLPYLYISPYKYWMCMQFDTAAHETDGTAQVTQRGYGSIVSVDKPSFSGSTSQGFDFGRTFNERRFYVNSDDLTPYAAASPLDIADENTALVTDVDFGMGAWNLEAAAGGMVTSFYPKYGVNRINLDRIVNGGKTKPGEIISLLISPNGSNRAGNEFSFWSGDFTAGAGAPVPAYQSHAIPQLVTKYFKPKQDNPGLGVVPAESNPYYPMYAFTLAGDYWYAYLIIDDEDIPDKYHKIHSYIPCNDNTDGPWLNSFAMERGGSDGNMGRLRAFGNREAIGKDNVGDTAGNYPIIYPTDDGLYNGTWGDSPARQSIQGLAGRCVDTRDGGSMTFPWVSGKVGGSGTQTKMSFVIHVTGEKSAADAEIFQLGGRVLIEQVSNKVQVKVWSTRSGAHHVKLTSATSLPRDGVTPTNIIVTVDTELTHGNVKLFMNGKLEAQSGTNVEDAGAGEDTRWQFGETIGNVDSCNITFGTYDGLYEEITTYLTCIYPVDISDNQGTFILEKPIEEITSSTLGDSKVYNARLFACDHHNIRGKNVCMSPQVSFKKAAFNIDGT